MLFDLLLLSFLDLLLPEMLFLQRDFTQLLDVLVSQRLIEGHPLLIGPPVLIVLVN